ncbi:MAG: hypothetical protein V4719_03450 [Planctomycetota bacterium]
MAGLIEDGGYQPTVRHLGQIRPSANVIDGNDSVDFLWLTFLYCFLGIGGGDD